MFLFRLAAHLGRMVYELETMPATEFDEWRQYYEIEPFGEWRDDLRTGILAALTANIHRDPKKGRRYQPKDFIPSFGIPAEKPKRDPAMKKLLRGAFG